MGGRGASSLPHRLKLFGTTKKSAMCLLDGCGGHHASNKFGQSRPYRKRVCHSVFRDRFFSATVVGRMAKMPPPQQNVCQHISARSN